MWLQIADMNLTVLRCTILVKLSIEVNPEYGDRLMTSDAFTTVYELCT